MAKPIDYVKEKDLNNEFNTAKQALLPRHEPMEEWERIARNQPYPNIPKNMPRVTDGTLAQVVQDTPKRIIQQIPEGIVEGADNKLNIVATYLLNHKLLPNNDEVVGLIQKCWAMASKCLTYGSQPVFVQVVKRGDYFGPDFTLPYIKDVFLEPGKLSDRESNIIWLRSWWSPSDIRAIIARNRNLEKRAKARGDDAPPDTGWVISGLQEALKATTAKDRTAETPNERGKNISSGYVQLVTCFQRGVGSNFYTFCPDLPEGKQVVRRETNKDPRGKIPIHFMYCNVDLSNPLGRGAVEMSGGMQNLLDSEVQSYQYMRALLMNPPLIIKGNVPNAVLKYAPQAQWRIGADPNADIQPAKLETASLQQFPQNYGLIKSQIMALNASSSGGTVGADAGNPQFSKTPAGIKQLESTLGISDKYFRMQFEDAFQEICETEINLYFAKRTGLKDIQVDQETADKLKDIAPDMVKETKDGEYLVRMNFSSQTPPLRFKVSAGSSEQEDDKEQIAGLQQLLKDAAADPYLVYQFASEQKEFSIASVYEQLFERYKIVGLEKIIKDIPEEKDANGNPVPGNQSQGGMNPMFDKPVVRINYQDLPPQAQIAALQNAGIQLPDPNAISQPNIDQQIKATPAATPPADPTSDPNHPVNHPMVKLMESLNIKFSDLPEDSKRELLLQIGLPTQEVSPTQQALNTDKAKIVTDAAKHITGQATQQDQMAQTAAEGEASRQHQSAESEAGRQHTSAEAEAARKAAAEQAKGQQNSGQAKQ